MAVVRVSGAHQSPFSVSASTMARKAFSALSGLSSLIARAAAQSTERWEVTTTYIWQCNIGSLRRHFRTRSHRHRRPNSRNHNPDERSIPHWVLRYSQYLILLHIFCIVVVHYCRTVQRGEHSATSGSIRHVTPPSRTRLYK